MEEEVSQPEPQKKPNIITIISLAIALISIVLAGISWYLTSSKVDDLTKKLGAGVAKIEDIKSKQAALEHENTDILKIALLSSAIHDIEGAVVTDDFVVNKMYAVEGDTGTLSIVMLDLDNQPGMALSYKGKGAYNIQDRELRAKCEAIIKKTMDQYNSQTGLPEWDDKTRLSISVRNYEVGNNESGSFALVGE